MDKTVAPVSLNLLHRPVIEPRLVSASSNFQKMLMELRSDVNDTVPSAQESARMLVGTISDKQPTVSDLLTGHDTLRGSAWEILSSEQNRNKEYTTLQPGTEVYFDPAHKALSWAVRESTVDTSQKPVNTAPLSEKPSGTAISTSGPVELGSISAELPTVSHLLKADARFGAEAWNILAAEVNRTKDFSRLPLNARVLYDPVTHEVSWDMSRPERQTMPREEVAALGPNAEIHDVSGGAGVERHAVGPGQVVSGYAREAVHSTPIAQEQGGAVSLGRIDAMNSTVSHLLTASPQYRDEAWRLLNNSVNINKPFERIPAGTEVFLDPASGEISWKSGDQPSPVQVISAVAQKKVYRQEPEFVRTMPASDLTEAVRPFMGKSYEDIDCYELLVEGLRRMDIPYDGRNGLQTRLAAMARERGLPANAFMNGEGIVRAAGSLVFSKSIPATSNWQADAEKLIEEMEPLLDKGQILSFSTEKRGHTGIVSQQNNQWTFINSGRLDNALTDNPLERGVGEEVLNEEVRNWFRLAQTNNESLSITLGKLEQNKVLTAYAMNEASAKQI